MTKMSNSQIPLVRYDSPFEKWPGYIEIYEHISGPVFLEYYELAETKAGEEYGILGSYLNKLPLLATFAIENMTLEQFEDPNKIPDIEIALWFNLIAGQKINAVLDPKKYLGLLPGTTKET